MSHIVLSQRTHLLNSFLMDLDSRIQECFLLLIEMVPLDYRTINANIYILFQLYMNKSLVLAIPRVLNFKTQG